MKAIKKISVLVILNCIIANNIAFGQSIIYSKKKEDGKEKTSTIYVDNDIIEASRDIGISRFLLNGQTICNGNDCYVYYNEPMIMNRFRAIPVYGGYLIPKEPRHPGEEEIKYIETPDKSKIINIDIDDKDNKEDDINVMYIKRPDGTKARYIEINDF